jgi:hypothetical protein
LDIHWSLGFRHSTFSRQIEVCPQPALTSAESRLKILRRARARPKNGRRIGLNPALLLLLFKN